MKKAVALKYNVQQDPAPRIIAKGQGEVAQKIIDLAIKHNIMTEENTELAQLLSSQELGDAIPIEAFQVVAQILVCLYQHQGKRI